MNSEATAYGFEIKNFFLTSMHDGYKFVNSYEIMQLKPSNVYFLKDMGKVHYGGIVYSFEELFLREKIEKPVFSVTVPLVDKEHFMAVMRQYGWEVK